MFLLAASTDLTDELLAALIEQAPVLVQAGVMALFGLGGIIVSQIMNHLRDTRKRNWDRFEALREQVFQAATESMNCSLAGSSYLAYRRLTLRGRKIDELTAEEGMKLAEKSDRLQQSLMGANTALNRLIIGLDYNVMKQAMDLREVLLKLAVAVMSGVSQGQDTDEDAQDLIETANKQIGLLQAMVIPAPTDKVKGVNRISRWLSHKLGR